MDYIKYAAKAIYATLVAVLGGVVNALTDSVITGSEWLIIGLTGAVAGVGVFAITNGPDPKPENGGEV